MKPVFLDTHPRSPVQSAKLSKWGKSSRPGIRYVDAGAVCFRVREGGSGGSTIVLFADGPLGPSWKFLPRLADPGMVRPSRHAACISAFQSASACGLGNE